MNLNKSNDDAWWDPAGKIGCISIALPPAAGLLLWTAPKAGALALGLALMAVTLVKTWAPN